MTYFICPKCGNIIDIDMDDDPTEIPLCPIYNCKSEMEPVDKEMVPILKKLHAKGYWTSFCCQGHLIRTPENNEVRIESLYIAFAPIKILDGQPQFIFNHPAGVLSSPLELIMRAANLNRFDSYKLTDYLPLNYKWKMENEIQIGARDAYVLHRRHFFYVIPDFDLNKCEDDKVEEDLRTIRQSMYNTVVNDLHWLSIPSPYIDIDMGEGYFTFFISPECEKYYGE